MSTSRPFAYNPSPNPLISGTTQVGDIAIGVNPTLNYFGGAGGVQWWQGPDEELGYIVAKPIPPLTQPNPLNIPAGVAFGRSLFTEEAFITNTKSSKTVNLNPFAVALKEGIVTLSPPMDNWVDIQKSPDLLIVDPNLQVYRASDNLNVLQVGDWKTTVATTTVATIASGRNWFTNQVTNDTQTVTGAGITTNLQYYVGGIITCVSGSVVKVCDIDYCELQLK